MLGRLVPALSVVLSTLLFGPVIAKAAFLDPNDPNVLKFTATKDAGFSTHPDELYLTEIQSSWREIEPFRFVSEIRNKSKKLCVLCGLCEINPLFLSL